MKYREKIDEERCKNQIIWHNSKILRDGLPFYLGHAFKNGLVFVHQLFKNMRVISCKVAYEKFGLSIMEFNTIVSAILNHWKIYIKNTEKTRYYPLPPHLYDTMLFVKNLSAKIYKFFVSQQILFYDKVEKSESDLNCEIGAIQFMKEVNKMYVTTNVTKLRSFQYRLMMRGLVMNIQMKHWVMLESDSS